MARTGADPEQLRAAADHFERAADQLELIDRRTTVRLRTVPWSGPDAERFARRWRSTGSPAVRRAAASCRAGARELRDQAREQVTASDHLTAGIGSTAGAGLRPLGPQPGPPPGLPPDPPPGPPLRSDRIRLTADGQVALLGGRGERALRIDQLADGRLAVTLEESLHGGLMTRGPGPASGSHLDATGGGARRREWAVDPEELPTLIAALGLESSPLGVVPQAVDSVADLTDAALGLVGIRTDLDRWSALPVLPPTDAVEHLAIVGTAGAVGLGPLRAGSAGSVAVGRRSDPTGDRTVIEWSESITGRVRAPWSVSLARTLGIEWEPRADATVEGRIELPDRLPATAGPRSAQIQITSTIGSERTVIDAVVEVDDSNPHPSPLPAAAAALASGDTRAAAEALTGTTLAGSTDWRITGYRVEEHRAAVPASVGIAGIAPSGSWERSIRR